MANVQFPAEPVSGFKVSLQLDGTACRIACAGTLDHKEVTVTLQPQLLALHDDLLRAGVQTVTLDFTAVDYMNSSAIKCFMAWFLRAERMKEGAYSIDVSYDPKRTWQFVSFTTMGRIAPKVLKTNALTVG